MIVGEMGIGNIMLSMVILVVLIGEKVFKFVGMGIGIFDE